MKRLYKLFAFCLIIGACLFCFCACTNGDSTTLKKGVTLSDIVDEIQVQISLQMPEPVNDATLVDLYYMDMNNVETYAGVAAMTITSCDTVVAVKAVPGKIDTVVSALKQRQQDLIDSFAQYLPEQYQKAQAGSVIVRGDYAFLIILGEAEDTINEDMQKAEDIINSYFQ
ncbi:DUF4358 domain-containing protein [Cellulosilyticum ruminicola]|uniref:DUF4358 domain-containing protein n=1 Tax=Cellulosilyticum ruminicola TaxID=425254 RepID=UPI0006CFC2DF|nr:DUF4358 domain-containing protein [Cellulosilyticum ruminicola]